MIDQRAAILLSASPFYLYGPYKREGFGPEQPRIRPEPSPTAGLHAHRWPKSPIARRDRNQLLVMRSGP